MTINRLINNNEWDKIYNLIKDDRFDITQNINSNNILLI